MKGKYENRGKINEKIRKIKEMGKLKWKSLPTWKIRWRMVETITSKNKEKWKTHSLLTVNDNKRASPSN